MPSEFIVYQNPLTVKKLLIERELKRMKQEKWIWMWTMKTLLNFLSFQKYHSFLPSDLSCKKNHAYNTRADVAVVLSPVSFWNWAYLSHIFSLFFLLAWSILAAFMKYDSMNRLHYFPLQPLNKVTSEKVFQVFFSQSKHVSHFFLHLLCNT